LWVIESQAGWILFVKGHTNVFSGGTNPFNEMSWPFQRSTFVISCEISSFNLLGLSFSLSLMDQLVDFCVEFAIGLKAVLEALGYYSPSRANAAV
jgi:hypothetical protein